MECFERLQIIFSVAMSYIAWKCSLCLFITRFSKTMTDSQYGQFMSITDVITVERCKKAKQKQL